jgi:hypothetical protein
VEGARVKISRLFVSRKDVINISCCGFKAEVLKLFGRGQGWTIHAGLGMPVSNASRKKYSRGWYQR